MPFFPESLYVLSQRDQQVTWLDPALSISSSVLAAALVIVDFTVPDGRVLVLQSAAVRSQPGAGQNIASQSLQLFRAGNAVALTEDFVAKAANVIGVLAWSGSLLVPPLWSVRAESEFNAGVAANSVRLSVAGLLVPVGNIQRL